MRERDLSKLHKALTTNPLHSVATEEGRALSDVSNDDIGGPSNADDFPGLDEYASSAGDDGPIEPNSLLQREAAYEEESSDGAFLAGEPEQASLAVHPADDGTLDDTDEDEVEELDESKELRAARMALLRKRRARKKAQRCVGRRQLPALTVGLTSACPVAATHPSAANLSLACRRRSSAHSSPPLPCRVPAWPLPSLARARLKSSRPLPRPSTICERHVER